MARPTTKDDLVAASNDNFTMLLEAIERLTETELKTEFNFIHDEKKREAHWKRDKNLRDVLIHLYEWHQLLINWIGSNMSGKEKSFLPEPYNWKSYGEMNVELWKKHQDTLLEDSKTMLRDSHNKVMELIASFTNEELFSKNVFSWTGTTTLGSYCVSATASHYDWAIKKLKAHIKNCKSI